MRIIAVNHIDMTDRLETLPLDWEVWSTDVAIPITYKRIVEAALIGGWDLDTIIVQDDVRFTVDTLPTPDAPLVIYGQTGENHVCPRAFAATPKSWSELKERWWGPQVCQAWKPMVYRVGTVLDITKHLEPVGSREA